MRSLPRISAALVLAALLASGGCIPKRSGLRSTESPVWTFSGEGLVSAVASEADGVLIVQSKIPPRVVGLELASGRQLWSAEAGGGALVSDAGVTLAQSALTRERTPCGVVALDTRTGQELWRTPRWMSEPAPKLRAGMAVGFTVDATFEAVDARTGEPIFAYGVLPNGASAAAPDERLGTSYAKAYWASTLTESGRLAFRPPGDALIVVDFRAKSVRDIPAPLMDYRSGIAAVGERVVVCGDARKDRKALDAESYWIQAFDVAAGTMIWSKHGAARRPLEVLAGPGGSVFVVDVAHGNFGDSRLAVYDAATGGEPASQPLAIRERPGLFFGGAFGAIAVDRGAELRAFSAPEWSPAWETKTDDPEADRARLAAADGVVLMHTDSVTAELGKSYVSESRITAFDLETGELRWRYVGRPLLAMVAAGGLAVGVGSEQVVALALRPTTLRRWPW